MPNTQSCNDLDCTILNANCTFTCSNKFTLKYNFLEFAISPSACSETINLVVEQITSK